MIIRCISLWQPWASLMACGAKYFETRSWDTKIRGTIYIHAAKTLRGIELVEYGSVQEREAIEAVLGPLAEWSKKLPLGAIVGRGELVDTMSACEALEMDPGQEPFGDFGAGRWVHVYDGLRALVPVPTVGRQGFWTTPVDEDVTFQPMPVEAGRVRKVWGHEQAILEGF